MGRLLKKGNSGNAKDYVTRGRAIRKLQISLADFRRLCIFKGIYPREPTRLSKLTKGHGGPQTFYYAKDIRYLAHEPVLAKFRQQKTFEKKLQRALGRRELGDASRLEKSRPQYTLDHIIRERYPSFLDAIRDLDDPLNMLFLFANMSSTASVSHRVVREADKLTNQWLAFVAKQRLITKVFVSIKGVYYEATVQGQEVRWLVPFKFPTNIPSEVDYRIMVTFLEFYSSLLHFVMYKLYTDAGLVFPPPIDALKVKGVGGLTAYVIQQQDQDGLVRSESQAEPTDVSEAEGVQLSEAEIKKAQEADNEAGDESENDADKDFELDEFSDNSKHKGDSLAQPTEFQSPTLSLFESSTFFVGREVPIDILEVCVLACGGKLVSEIALDELKLNSPEEFAKLDLSNITHQIVDRPKIAHRVAGRTYVQPQWVFDCINKAELLLVNEYAPGETLPPHLSPWGDGGAYDPTAPVDDVAEESQESAASGSDSDLEAEDEQPEVTETETAQPKSKKAKKQTAEEEEHELRKIMMSKKNQKRYAVLKGKDDASHARTEALRKKKQQLEKAKKKASK